MRKNFFYIYLKQEVLAAHLISHLFQQGFLVIGHTFIPGVFLFRLFYTMAIDTLLAMVI